MTQPVRATLADAFISAAAQLKVEGKNGGMSHIVEMAKRIKSAQKFFITNDVAETCVSVMRSKPSSLVSALSFARPPFGACWFERDGRYGGEVKPGQIATDSVGMLIEATEDDCSAYTVMTAWKFNPTQHRRMVIDETGEDMISKIPRRLQDASHLGISVTRACVDTVAGRRPKTGFPILMRGNGYNPDVSEEDNKAMDDLRTMIHGDVVDEALINDLVEASIVDSVKTSGQAESLRADVESEMGIVLGSLILMNAKNGAETVEVKAPEKLNRARMKRGDLPLVDYSEVRIKVSQAAERALADGRAEHADIRRHIVRGHFKVRSSGVYWWHPHLRGSLDAGLLGRTGHKVTP